MEILVLGIFALFILITLIWNWSILYALGAGLLLFWAYGLRKGFSWKDMFQMSLSGVKTAKNVIIMLLLVGVLTAYWRSCGTIAIILSSVSALIRPAVFLAMCFWLNCLISFLMGTAFGTAATMGVICATMGAALGISPVLLGGAMLSGVFFGDRCSPVSTSALLVSELTKTDIFSNIKGMFKTSWVPFIASSLIYLAVGMLTPRSGEMISLSDLFSREFNLQWAGFLPAAAILILSLCRVKVRMAMTVSIVISVAVGVLTQGRSAAELWTTAISGFTAQDAQVAAMMNGGGVVSMLKVVAIIFISSCYSGIFEKTGLLLQMKAGIGKLSRKMGAYATILLMSGLLGMIACNQTLNIMLTHQLCDEVEPDPDQMAMDLENSVVVVSPLIPWCIAGAVPLATVGSPLTSILFACYLYLLPAWQLIKKQ